MQKIGCVYILSSKTRVLYIGVTSRPQKRIYEHKNGIVDGFSKKYKTHSLVYFECTENMYSALAREKQLKKWRKGKKILLILAIFPLSINIFNFASTNTLSSEIL
ncbi:MAG: GIY-YIG nuclease family protein [Candidatus Moranbacteria bacterium]|nr:GIY-YIG nuclease family protein [Candidatus Moranbacteria bacterium]